MCSPSCPLVREKEGEREGGKEGGRRKVGGKRIDCFTHTTEMVKKTEEKRQAPPTPTKTPSQTSLVGTPNATPTSSVDSKEIGKQLRSALDDNLQ